MKHTKGLNKKAKKLEERSEDVQGYACNDCCASFSPGWEVGSNGVADPCPMASDLSMCFNAGCFWAGQIPDDSTHPTWFSNCSNVAADWVNLPNENP